MYRTDEPNDDETRIEFELATKMLSSIFSDDKTSVDITSFNASRVWKVYGTISAKGSSTVDRPHRVAAIVRVPDTLVAVSRGQIENVARPLKEARSDEFKDMTGEYIADMVKWLTDRGQTVTSGPYPMFGSEGQKWRIASCPFNHNHQHPIVGLVNNRPVFRCLHHSCAAFRWKEFREKIDPSYKDPDTIYTRLALWCNGTDDTPDAELIQSAAALGKKLDGIYKRLRKDVPRVRVILLEELIKGERRRFQRETIGENNEKGNLVGLINKTRILQAEGLAPPYWINDFDHRIRAGEIGDVEARRVTEADEISLLVKFHSMGETWVRQNMIAQVIRHLAEEYRVNPLRTYLKKLRWDGVRRLDTWLHVYLGTKPGEYTEAIGRKWVISAVARAMDPGCQADHMLILEGAQGIGKSQALRALGGNFYTEYSGGMKGGMGHKDMVQVIVGKMIVEMSELATIKRADMESLKAILTTTVDDVRMAYERDAMPYPRTCVFAGTTNEVGQAYIADQSGARRFWPCLVGEVHKPNVPALRTVVDELWAEAVEAYQNGEDWYTVPQTVVMEEQIGRQITVEASEPWFEPVRRAITDPDSYNNGCFFIRPTFEKGQPTGESTVRAGAVDQILNIVLGVEVGRQSAMDVLRVSKILREIGFKKVRPSGGWAGSTYAYDLQKDMANHMWPFIEAALKVAKLPPGVKSFHE
jgi:hypothetical protein